VTGFAGLARPPVDPRSLPTGARLPERGLSRCTEGPGFLLWFPLCAVGPNQSKIKTAAGSGSRGGNAHRARGSHELPAAILPQPGGQHEPTPSRLAHHIEVRQARSVCLHTDSRQGRPRFPRCVRRDLGGRGQAYFTWSANTTPASSSASAISLCCLGFSLGLGLGLVGHRKQRLIS
jgi:hypothetical protein